MTSRKISKIEKLQCLLSNILINQKEKNILIAVVSLFKENWLYEKFSLFYLEIRYIIFKYRWD